MTPQVSGLGDNQLAQMAVDVGTYTITLVQNPDLTNIIQISAGTYHCLAVNGSGNAYAWGGSDIGQTGLGTTTAIETPTLLSGLNSIAQVEAGNDFSLFRNSAGTLWGAGSSSLSQLAAISSTNSPTQLAAPTGVSLLTCGGAHSLAFTTTTLAWGANSAGQCGNGQQSDQYTGLPTPAERDLTW